MIYSLIFWHSKSNGYDEYYNNGVPNDVYEELKYVKGEPGSLLFMPDIWDTAVIGAFAKSSDGARNFVGRHFYVFTGDSKVCLLSNIDLLFSVRTDGGGFVTDNESYYKRFKEQKAVSCGSASALGRFVLFESLKKNHSPGDVGIIAANEKDSLLFWVNNAIKKDKKLFVVRKYEDNLRKDDMTVIRAIFNILSDEEKALCSFSTYWSDGESNGNVKICVVNKNSLKVSTKERGGHGVFCENDSYITPIPLSKEEYPSNETLEALFGPGASCEKLNKVEVGEELKNEGSRELRRLLKKPVKEHSIVRNTARKLNAIVALSAIFASLAAFELYYSHQQNKTISDLQIQLETMMVDLKESVLVSPTASEKEDKLDDISQIAPEEQEETAEKPAIITHPIGSEVVLGEVVSLSVIAEPPQNGVLSYHWYKNDEEMISNDNSSNNLTITGAEETDAGEYYVIVRNTRDLDGNGQITAETVSDKVSIVIVKGAEEPVIDKHPLNEPEKRIGEVLTFTVKAHSTDGGLLTYQWYKDSEPIGGAVNEKLEISAITADDSGEYYVIVTNTNVTTGKKAEVKSDTAIANIN